MDPLLDPLSDPLVVAQIAVQAAQDVLLAVAVGALANGAMLGWQRRGLAAAASASMSAPPALGRLRFVALALLVLACGLYLWLQAAVMGGASFSDAGPVVGTVLTQSHFGVAWSVGFAGAVLACFGGARHSRATWWLAAAGMVVYVAGKAAASHAADAGDFTFREAVHVVHLGATAAWAGSVLVAAPLWWRWNAAERADGSVEAANRVAFCTRLSHLATIALAVVIVTGIYNATQDTAHLTAPLLDVLYGRVLALKLVLVTLAVLLGGYNRMVHLPRLQHTAADGGAPYRNAQHSFDRLLAVEAVAMAAILIAAGVLGHTSPSAG
ncbi:CopD family protein [Paraburkholderia sp. BCC1885]|uniref:CopD family protein n=1 Tax=Paraburkholderia sp. BCC1885 TaxID=2562669 RepID=UPI0011824073|nr:CopD family protein [Paraburkholderia sp. BCC1885]